MSLIHNNIFNISKQINRKPVYPVYKNTLNVALAGVLAVFGASFAPSLFAQSMSDDLEPIAAKNMALKAPMTLSQTTVMSTKARLLDPNASKDRDLRAKAMQEAAQSYGARSGLMRRTYEIKVSIDASSSYMDAIWNFRPLMLTDVQLGEESGTMRQRMIVPAVITQAQTIFKQDTPGMIRMVDKSYKIQSQPKFSSVTPNWRDYLFRNLGESDVNPPHVSLLPRTSEEKSNWDSWIAQGWDSGYSQADDYFEYDLNRLNRDWDGMINYHEMVIKNMVSLPYVATSNDSITGDETTMNINDSLLRITVMPAFQRDSKAWVAYKSDF